MGVEQIDLKIKEETLKLRESAEIFTQLCNTNLFIYCFTEFFKNINI